MGGGGRGSERLDEGKGGVDEERDKFRCGSFGISLLLLEFGGRGGGLGLLGGGGGGGVCEEEEGRGVEGIGGLLFWGGGGGIVFLWMEGLLFIGGGGGGGLLFKVLFGVGGRGGLLEKGEEEFDGVWRMEFFLKVVFRFLGKGGGVGLGLGCLGVLGIGGDFRLCRFDWMGFGVLGIGGGTLLGFEFTLGFGGGIRFFWGFGGLFLWFGEGSGNFFGLFGGKKGLVDVVFFFGGKIGGRFVLEFEEEEKKF